MTLLESNLLFEWLVAIIACLFVIATACLQLRVPHCCCDEDNIASDNHRGVLNDLAVNDNWSRDGGNEEYLEDVSALPKAVRHQHYAQRNNNVLLVYIRKSAALAKDVTGTHANWGHQGRQGLAGDREALPIRTKGHAGLGDDRDQGSRRVHDEASRGGTTVEGSSDDLASFVVVVIASVEQVQVNRKHEFNHLWKIPCGENLSLFIFGKHQVTEDFFHVLGNLENSIDETEVWANFHDASEFTFLVFLTLIVVVKNHHTDEGLHLHDESAD